MFVQVNVFLLWRGILENCLVVNLISLEIIVLQVVLIEHANFGTSAQVNVSKLSAVTMMKYQTLVLIALVINLLQQAQMVWLVFTMFLQVLALLCFRVMTMKLVRFSLTHKETRLLPLQVTRLVKFGPLRLEMNSKLQMVTRMKYFPVHSTMKVIQSSQVQKTILVEFGKTKRLFKLGMINNECEK